MNYKEYYISDINGKSNCIIRTMCKVLNKEYSDVYNELLNISKELNSLSYTDVEVFETYMNNNNIYKIDCKSNTKICDLKLDNNTYVIFCWDKKDFYHMFPIIDNTIYDKKTGSENLYCLSIYKLF